MPAPARNRGHRLAAYAQCSAGGTERARGATWRIMSPTDAEGKIESSAGSVLASALEAAERDHQAAIGPTSAVRLPRRILAGVRLDLAFGACVVVGVMSLAIYAAGPGAGVLLGSAVAGLTIAVLRIRRSGRQRENSWLG